MRTSLKVNPCDYGSRTWSRRRVGHAVRKRLREESRLEDIPCTCGAITALNPCPYCGGDRADDCEDTL